MQRTLKSLLTASAWMLALACIVAYASWPNNGVKGLAAAGLFVGMVALCLTFDWLLEHHLSRHRIRVQQILAISEAERVAKGLDRIH